MSFLYSGSGFKDTSMYKSPWQFVGSLFLVAIAAVALWYGLRMYLSPVAPVDESAMREEVEPVDESVRMEMLNSRTDLIDEDAELVDDEVRESALTPREPSPNPEDNEPVPSNVRNNLLD